MQIFNVRYNSIGEFERYLDTQNIQDGDNLLLQIFTSINDEEIIAALLQDITKLLPRAQIIGATTDGEICNEKVMTHTTVISISIFEKTKLKTALVTNVNDSKKMGQEMAQELLCQDTKLIITFADGLYTNGEEYLQGLASVDEKVIVAGGMAGDYATFRATYVFTRDKIVSNGAVGVSLSNKELMVFTDHNFNWLTLGRDMIITHVEKNRVYTIDGISAYDIYKKYLGEETAQQLPAIGIEYPLVIKKDGKRIARAVLARHDDGSLSFAGNLSNGDIVHFGYGDAASILHSSVVSQNKLLNQPVEAIFVYSCMVRRRFMPDLSNEEIEPLNKIAPTAGFFTYGEFFSSHGNKELLNQTMTILALSESQKIVSSKPLKQITNTRLNDYQKSIRALSHLLSATIHDLNEENNTLNNNAAKLHIREESLRLAQEIGHFGSWDVNLITKETLWSQESYNIYKVDKSVKPTLDTFLSRIIEEDKPKAAKKLEEMHDGKIKRIELRATRDDGVIINILLNGQMILNEEGIPIRMIGTTLDITEIVELRENNKRQALILEQIHDSVVASDMNGTIIHWNNGAKEMHGYSYEEIMGKSVYMLYPENALEKIKHMRELVLQNGTCKDEITKITKSGTLIQTDVTLSLLKNENGEVIGVIGFSQDITQKKEVENKLQKQTELLNHQAYHDQLTNLPNRILFDDRLEQSIANSKRHDESFALLFIDLDNFKEINDTLGHNIGDKVLQLIAKKLSTCVRMEDSLSRLGGDEFTIILQNIKTPIAAAEVAQKLLDIINTKLTVNNHEIYLSASIGISIYPKDAFDKNDIIKFADSAMYKAKEKGKNSYTFYSVDMTKITFEKVMLQNSMRTAITNEEFIVYYQPQINAKKGVITGMEALVRWKHPSMGLVSPVKFIPLAEESGFIIHLDNYVMKQAMKDFTYWYSIGMNPGVLSLNLSIKQLVNDDFINYLTNTAKEIDFNLKWLELEITETQMMQDPLASIKKLNIISDMGIEIAIDDFGTGYSSLAYLKRLPVDKLKIDKSFIDNLPEDEEDCAISKAVIALAKSLNLKIIAEGVEYQKQKDFLLDNGCENIQGYYYSCPIPKEEMEFYLFHF